MPDPQAHPPREHVPSNTCHDDSNRPRKRWNPDLQCIDTSATYTESPRSPVSNLDSDSPQLERSHNSYLDPSRGAGLVSSRSHNHSTANHGPSSLNKTFSAVSPPQIRRNRDASDRESFSRSKPTSFQISSHNGGESYRPTYEIIRPSTNLNQSIDKNQIAASYNSYQDLSRQEPGLKIRGLASSSGVSVLAAVSTAPREMIGPCNIIDRSPMLSSEIESPTRHVPSSLEAELAKSSTLEQKLGATSSETIVTKTTLTPQTSRSAVMSLLGVPAFRKGGTPGSEITTSSKAASLKNQCRACGGLPEALHPLLKCKSCPRRYHRSCGYSKLRTDKNRTDFTCYRCLTATERREIIGHLKRECNVPLRMDELPEVNDNTYSVYQTNLQAKNDGIMADHPPAEPTSDHSATALEDGTQGREADPPSEPAADRNVNQSLLTKLPPRQLRNRGEQTQRYEKPCSQTTSRSRKEAEVSRSHLLRHKDIVVWADYTALSYRRVMCPWWAKGDCHHTKSDCLFAHERTNIRTPIGQEINRDWTCYYWYNSSSCPYQDCNHAHYDTGLYVGIDGRASRKLQTCFWWNRNRKCNKGDSCPFSHEWTGRVSEDPAKKPGGVAYQRQSRPSLQSNRQSSTNLSETAQMFLPDQQSKESLLTTDESRIRASDPRLDRSLPRTASHQYADGSKHGLEQTSIVMSPDRITDESQSIRDVTLASNGMPSPKLKRCSVCAKRIFAAEKCATCYSADEILASAELDDPADNLDLSALVANELGVSDRENPIKDSSRLAPSIDDRYKPVSKVIKRKAMNERMFQPSKRHKPNVDVAEICNKVKPPPNLTNPKTTLSLSSAAKETAIFHRLRGAEIVTETPAIVDLPNTTTAWKELRATPHRPTYSPCPDLHAGTGRLGSTSDAFKDDDLIEATSNLPRQDVPALDVETSLLTNSDDAISDTALPNPKENQPLWSQSTEEFVQSASDEADEKSDAHDDEAEEESEYESDEEIHVQNRESSPAIERTAAVPRKASCLKCRQRHRKCEHDISIEEGSQPMLRHEASTAAVSPYQQIKQIMTANVRDDFSREGSTRSATAVSRLSDTSRSVETPATSVAPSVDGSEAWSKETGYPRRTLNLTRPRTIGQISPIEAPKSTVLSNKDDEDCIQSDSLESLLDRLRLKGVVIEEDYSDDDSQDDALPQMSDPPPPSKGKFDKIWLPPMTYGQGMKNKDKRAVLQRSMILNQQVFGNKHYSRESKQKSVLVRAQFERKIHSTRDRLAVPKLQETTENATFGEYLGLPKDFEPEPTLGPGEGSWRELYMRNREVAGTTGNARRRRAKANEIWPIRGE